MANAASEIGKARGHRWFAFYYEFLSRGMEARGMGERRSRLLEDLRGNILEVGAGNGLNLSHYRQIDRLIALEPDPYMIQRLGPRAHQVAFPVEIVPAGAEALPFDAGIFDAVVTTLVLCSVANLATVLSEIHRVLKPGGQLRFIEHVRAGGIGGQLQDLIAPVWSYFGAGCRPNRRTEEVIRGAGFEIGAVERFRMGLLPFIVGTAARIGA